MIFGKDMSTLRKLMLLKAATGGAPLNEYEASGNPLTFNTNKAKPLPSALASWLPHQSGSGDPAPSNVRSISGRTGVTVWQTGKNLLNVAEFVDNKVWWQGSLAQGYTGYKASYKIPVVPNAKYTLYKSKTGQNQLQYFDADGQYISQNAGALGYEVSKFTIPDGVYFIGINLDKESLATAQLEIGETASEYEPYHGTTYAVEFPAVGRNLFDVSTVGFTPSKYIKYEDGTLGSWGSSWNASGFMPIDENTDYVLQCSCNGLSDAGIAFYDDNKEFISGVPTASITGVFTFTTPTNAKYLRFSCVTPDTNPAQIEYGSTPHPYEPYTRTVYGGSLDLTTGVLTATHVCESLKDRTWSYYSPSGKQTYRTEIENAKISGGGICNKYKYGAYTYISSLGDLECSLIEMSGKNMLCIRDDSYVSAVPAFTESMADGYFCYELATPQTYQLSPTQITALLGNNTMWSDADSLSVTYLKKG